MLTKTLSVVLLTCALFSGQLLAKQQDHAFVWFATGGHQLRHEADSDELRAAAFSSALQGSLKRQRCRAGAFLRGGF